MPFMRLSIFVILFISWVPKAFSQKRMETTCMHRIKEFSGDIRFPKFDGAVSTSKDTVKFDRSIITIQHSEPPLKRIFEIGLVFPDLIYGASTLGDKFEFKKIAVIDTIAISGLSEMKLVNAKGHVKWFSFLIWHKMMANPSLYIFELTNNTATSATTMKAFIENASVTAFGFCSVLI